MTIFKRSLIVLITISIGLSAHAKKSNFTPLPGFWYFDQVISTAGSFYSDVFTGKCTLLFDSRSKGVGVNKEFFDNFEDALIGNSKNSNYYLMCSKNSFYGNTTINSPTDLQFSGTYKNNSTGEFANEFKISELNPVLKLELDPESNKRLVGTISFPTDKLAVFIEHNVSLTRQEFIANARLFLRNSIKPLEKGAITAGDTVTFVAQVKSSGPTTLANREGELYISLNDEISAGDISILTTAGGSVNISTCSEVIDSSIPAQIQCRLKDLGKNNDTAKLVFRVSVPDTLEKKNLVIGVASTVNDDYLKIISRPASFKTRVKEASPAKISCVVKGPSPLKKSSGLVNAAAGENSAIISSFELSDDNNTKRYIIYIAGTQGKASTIFSLAGNLSGNPSFASLSTGEVVKFQSINTGLSLNKAALKPDFTVIQSNLALSGAGPFEGLIQITGTGKDDFNRDTISGQIAVKMSGAEFTKEVGSKTKTKTVGTTTITCKFRDIRDE